MGQRLLMLTALASLWAFVQAGPEANTITSAIQVTSLVSIVLCVLGPRRPYQRAILMGFLIPLVCFLLARFWVISHGFVDRTDLPSPVRTGSIWLVTAALAWPLPVFAVAIYSLMRFGGKGSA